MTLKENLKQPQQVKKSSSFMKQTCRPSKQSLQVLQEDLAPWALIPRRYQNHTRALTTSAGLHKNDLASGPQVTTCYQVRAGSNR
jgi:hypothetical protein